MISIEELTKWEPGSPDIVLKMINTLNQRHLIPDQMKKELILLGCCLLDIDHGQDKKHENEQLILHRYTPSLEVIVEHEPP